MMQASLTSALFVASVILFVLYRQKRDRVAALERRVKLLHETVALERHSQTLMQGRIKLMEVAVNLDQERIALLVGQNEEMHQQLQTRDLYPLPLPVTVVHKN